MVNHINFTRLQKDMWASMLSGVHILIHRIIITIIISYPFLFINASKVQKNHFGLYFAYGVAFDVAGDERPVKYKCSSLRQNQAKRNSDDIKQ